MMPMPRQVLVVEDFEPFRRFICSIVSELGLTEIHEACDGEQAVEAASKYQPELILLDIGLPKLNGIEVARRIREGSPRSTILFVSQEFSPEVIAEAFRAGGIGYLAKPDAGRDLASAICVSMRGERFVSSRVQFALDAV
jgi:DNA-binding NarL/FixJ family response regulator